MNRIPIQAHSTRQLAHDEFTPPVAVHNDEASAAAGAVGINAQRRQFSQSIDRAQSDLCGWAERSGLKDGASWVNVAHFIPSRREHHDDDRVRCHAARLRQTGVGEQLARRGIHAPRGHETIERNGERRGQR
jgi:hypothetical protein